MSETDILTPEQRLALDHELADADRAHAANRRKIVTAAIDNAKWQRRQAESERARNEKLTKAKDFIDELMKHGIDRGMAIKFLEFGYDPEEYATWAVYGEDPNCDMGGHHHNPDLGRFEGKYKDICVHAHALKSFYTWGGGGRIEKVYPTKVIKIG